MKNVIESLLLVVLGLFLGLNAARISYQPMSKIIKEQDSAIKSFKSDKLSWRVHTDISTRAQVGFICKMMNDSSVEVMFIKNGKRAKI